MSKKSLIRLISENNSVDAVALVEKALSNKMKSVIASRWQTVAKDTYGRLPEAFDTDDQPQYMGDQDNAYTMFFQQALKKFGVSGPQDFKDENTKQQFFNYLDQNWKAQDSVQPQQAAIQPQGTPNGQVPNQAPTPQAATPPVAQNPVPVANPAPAVDPNNSIASMSNGGPNLDTKQVNPETEIDDEDEDPDLEIGDDDEVAQDSPDFNDEPEDEKQNNNDSDDDEDDFDDDAYIITPEELQGAVDDSDDSDDEDDFENDSDDDDAENNDDSDEDSDDDQDDDDDSDEDSDDDDDSENDDKQSKSNKTDQSKAPKKNPFIKESVLTEDFGFGIDNAADKTFLLEFAQSGANPSKIRLVQRGLNQVKAGRDSMLKVLKKQHHLIQHDKSVSPEHKMAAKKNLVAMAKRNRKHFRTQAQQIKQLHTGN